MKDTMNHNHEQLFLGSLLDALKDRDKLPNKSNQEKQLNRGRYERPERRDFPWFMQVLDGKTQRLVGHISDISIGGFKLDSVEQLPINQDFYFKIAIPSDISEKSCIQFSARSRWYKIDPLDPFVYNTGFQLTNITPVDFEIFHRMMEKYGATKESAPINWARSNKW